MAYLNQDADIDEEYKNYVKKHYQELVDNFFEDNYDHEWFKERYCYDRLLSARKERKEYVLKALDKFTNRVKELDFPSFTISEETKSQVKRYSPVPIERTVLLRLPNSDICINSFDLELKSYLEAINDEPVEFVSHFGDFVTDRYGSSRSVWLVFEDKNRAIQLVEQGSITLPSMTVKTSSLHVADDFETTPVNFCLPKRLETDLKQATELAQALDREEELELGVGIVMEKFSSLEKNNEFENILASLPETDIHKKQLIEKKDDLPKYLMLRQQLDMVLLYLREVHLVCYYSCMQYKGLGDMLKDNLNPKFRPALPSGSAKAILEMLEKDVDINFRPFTDLDTWVDELVTATSQEAITKRLKVREADCMRLAALEEEEINRFCEENTIQTEGAFRCKLPPQKLFRGKQFVKKHILSKHKARINDVKKGAIKLLAKEIFARDPNKPLPPESHFLEKGTGAINRKRFIDRKAVRPRNVVEKIVTDVPAATTRTVIDYSDL